MQQIYLDNASTTFPKPPEVAEAVYEYMTGVGSNIGRGGYASAYAAAFSLQSCQSMPLLSAMVLSLL